MRLALRFRDGLRHKFPRPLRERVRVRGQKKPLKTHMTLSVIPQQFECITPELWPCRISKETIKEYNGDETLKRVQGDVTKIRQREKSPTLPYFVTTVYRSLFTVHNFVTT